MKDLLILVPIDVAVVVGYLNGDLLELLGHIGTVVLTFSLAALTLARLYFIVKNKGK